MFCAFEAPQSRDGLPLSCAVFFFFAISYWALAINLFNLLFVLAFTCLCLLQLLHRNITALLALEVFEWVATPILIVATVAHDIDCLVNGVTHRLRIGQILARNVECSAVVGFK